PGVLGGLGIVGYKVGDPFGHMLPGRSAREYGLWPLWTLAGVPASGLVAVVINSTSALWPEDRPDAAPFFWAAMAAAGLSFVATLLVGGLMQRRAHAEA